jgi:hypothetical protein
MENDTPATFPLPEETLEMMEAHQQLTAAYAFDYSLAQEQDSFSLAQPSPLRYVPSIASNGSAPMIEGA